jgi:hypothetical protein
MVLKKFAGAEECEKRRRHMRGRYAPATLAPALALEAVRQLCDTGIALKWRNCPATHASLFGGHDQVGQGEVNCLPAVV